MDRRQRIAILSEAALADRESPASDRLQQVPSADGFQQPGAAVGITAVRIGGGGVTRLMRVMQTNACSLSCGYCPTYAGGKVRRTALSPEEVATTFMEAQRRGQADGLFLTSGVPGRAHRAMDRMLAAVEILRSRHRFGGYIHLKLLPGCEAAQAEQAARLANRVSINLEAPGDRYLKSLAPEKNFSGHLLPTLEQVGRLFRAAVSEGRRERAVAGTTTQFVVGAAGERDCELLSLVARLERQRLLHHAHFSAFQPVVGTPMEGSRPVPTMREARLYQAEHLLRRYGFRYDELVFEADGNLALERDPKTTWALAHPAIFPLEICTAPYELLLRVPGIGPRGAVALVTHRRRAVLRGLGDLRALGVEPRAAWYLTLGGRRLAAAPAPEQLRLFRYGEHLTQGPMKTVVPPCAYR
jgi:predicted DNA-binding helix-hairpin-helix protein